MKKNKLQIFKNLQTINYFWNKLSFYTNILIFLPLLVWVVWLIVDSSSIWDYWWIFEISFIALIQYIKVFIYLMPSKFSYWAYRKDVLDAICNYVPKNKVEIEIFDNFINNKNRISYNHFSNPDSKWTPKLPIDRYLIFVLNSVPTVISTGNLGKGFKGKIKITFLILFSIFPLFVFYDPYKAGIKQVNDLLIFSIFLEENNKIAEIAKSNYENSADKFPLFWPGPKNPSRFLFNINRRKSLHNYPNDSQKIFLHFFYELHKSTCYRKQTKELAAK